MADLSDVADRLRRTPQMQMNGWGRDEESAGDTVPVTRISADIDDPAISMAVENIKARTALTAHSRWQSLKVSSFKVWAKSTPALNLKLLPLTLKPKPLNPKP
jgi:hypothetical protein